MEKTRLMKVTEENNNLGFIALSTKYCVFLENEQTIEQRAFIDTMRKLLASIYINVPEEEMGEESYFFSHDTNWVTENDYNYIRNNVYKIMGEYDEYLEVFAQDMVYSDKPILQTISENLADIYQSLRNYIEAYKTNSEEIIQEATANLIYDFNENWGQKLVNCLRALHEVRFNLSFEE